jgi:hypothetical protein
MFFFWVTAAGDTRTEVRELHQSPAVYRMYLVEDCRSNLLFESCWEVELEVGDCVCVCARARRISGYPLPRPQLHTKLNNLLDKK